MVISLIQRKDVYADSRISDIPAYYKLGGVGGVVGVALQKLFVLCASNVVSLIQLIQLILLLKSPRGISTPENTCRRVLQHEDTHYTRSICRSNIVLSVLQVMLPVPGYSTYYKLARI